MMSNSRENDLSRNSDEEFRTPPMLNCLSVNLDTLNGQLSEDDTFQNPFHVNGSSSSDASTLINYSGGPSLNFWGGNTLPNQLPWSPTQFAMNSNGYDTSLSREDTLLSPLRVNAFSHNLLRETNYPLLSDPSPTHNSKNSSEVDTRFSKEDTSVSRYEGNYHSCNPSGEVSSPSLFELSSTKDSDSDEETDQNSNKSDNDRSCNPCGEVSSMSQFKLSSSNDSDSDEETSTDGEETDDEEEYRSKQKRCPRTLRSVSKKPSKKKKNHNNTEKMRRLMTTCCFEALRSASGAPDMSRNKLLQYTVTLIDKYLTSIEERKKIVNRLQAEYNSMSS